MNRVQKCSTFNVVALLVFLAFQVGIFLSWEHLSTNASGCFGDWNNVVSENGEELDATKQMEDRAYFGGVKPRAFKSWPEDRPLPCGEASDRWWSLKVQRSPSKVGYLFVKEMKTGSSTVGGVVLRIARNVAKRQKQEGQCVARIDHTSAADMQYGRRKRGESFLFTMLRNPIGRTTSEFFHFQVSRNKIEPTDNNFKRFIHSRTYTQDYYIRDLNLVENLRPVLRRYTVDNSKPNELVGIRTNVANKIIQNYDFIGITERMDESLVVMQMLLGLKTTDMLYLKAKGSGGFDDGAFNETCVFIVKSYVSPTMEEYFASEEWTNRVQGDIWLYRAANHSLDLTIDQLGRDKFGQQLINFRKAMTLAHEICDVNKIQYPCSPSGVRAENYVAHVINTTDCLWLDSGCGYKCLDENSDEIENALEA